MTLIYTIFQNAVVYTVYVQKVLLHLLTPVLSTMVIKRLQVGELEAAAALLEAEVILGEVSDLLKDGRSFILATHQPTYLGMQTESLFFKLLINCSFCPASMNLPLPLFLIDSFHPAPAF
jgi:hypothetical protein